MASWLNLKSESVNLDCVARVTRDNQGVYLWFASPIGNVKSVRVPQDEEGKLTKLIGGLPGPVAPSSESLSPHFPEHIRQMDLEGSDDEWDDRTNADLAK